MQEHALKSTAKFKVTDKFATSFDAVEEELKSSTVGLVTLEQMREKEGDSCQGKRENK